MSRADAILFVQLQGSKVRCSLTLQGVHNQPGPLHPCLLSPLHPPPEGAELPMLLGQHFAPAGQGFLTFPKPRVPQTWEQEAGSTLQGPSPSQHWYLAPDGPTW